MLLGGAVQRNILTFLGHNSSQINLQKSRAKLILPSWRAKDADFAEKLPEF